MGALSSDLIFILAISKPPFRSHHRQAAAIIVPFLVSMAKGCSTPQPIREAFTVAQIAVVINAFVLRPRSNQVYELFDGRHPRETPCIGLLVDRSTSFPIVGSHLLMFIPRRRRRSRLVLFRFDPFNTQVGFVLIKNKIELPTQRCKGRTHETHRSSSYFHQYGTFSMQTMTT